MGVRVWSSCDGDLMAQMDPAGTNSASPMTDYSDYRLSHSPMQSASKRASESADVASSDRACPSTADNLIAALRIAADRTATSIAHGTKQTRVEVRERLNEVITWVIATLRTNASLTTDAPVIARE